MVAAKASTPKGKQTAKSVKKTPRSSKKTPKTSNKAKQSGTPVHRPAKVPNAFFGSPIQEAQARLHVSAVPDALPCREDKFAEIYSFTGSAIRDQAGGCIYISGVPGTGKTATVKEVVRCLQAEVMDGELDDFTFVEINGMRLTEPSQVR